MTTSSAGTGGAQQFNQSVRLRIQAAEDAAKPKPVAEVNEFLAAHEARVAAAKEKERADIAAGRLTIL
jgi:hypothetical protein